MSWSPGEEHIFALEPCLMNLFDDANFDRAMGAGSLKLIQYRAMFHLDFNREVVHFKTTLIS